MVRLTDRDGPRRALATSLLGLLALLAVLRGTLAAQAIPGNQTDNTQPATFKYYVWGEVRSPGVYRLGPNLDIIELLSAAGGPSLEADLSRVTLVQGMDQKRVTIDLRKALSAGNVIHLMAGDVVIVPRSFWYRFRDDLSFVSSFLILLNLYFTIAYGR